MWSNCVIEALKAVWRNPYNRVYLVIDFNWEYLRPEVHCYWFEFSRMRYYHFFAANRRLPYFSKLWHEGRIRKYRFHRYSKSWRVW